MNKVLKSLSVSALMTGMGIGLLYGIDVILNSGDVLKQITWNEVSLTLNKVKTSGNDLEINGNFGVNGKLCLENGQCLGECANFQHWDATTTSCASNTKTCNITNGTGTQTWTGNAWGSCVVSSCSSGYYVVGNVCVVSNCTAINGLIHNEHIYNVPALNRGVTSDFITFTENLTGGTRVCKQKFVCNNGNINPSGGEDCTLSCNSGYKEEGGDCVPGVCSAQVYTWGGYAFDLPEMTYSPDDMMYGITFKGKSAMDEGINKEVQLACDGSNIIQIASRGWKCMYKNVTPFYDLDTTKNNRYRIQGYYSEPGGCCEISFGNTECGKGIDRRCKLGELKHTSGNHKYYEICKMVNGF